MSSFVPSATAVHKNSFGKFRHTFTTTESSETFLPQTSTMSSMFISVESQSHRHDSSASFSQYHTRAPDGGIRIAYCPPPKPAQPSKRVNSTTQQGAASDSTNRYVLAERFRTRLCRNFVTSRQTVLRADGSTVYFGGSCPYEARCMFAHSEEELRTPLMNVEDGLLSEEAIQKFKRACQIALREAKERAYQSSKQQRLRAQAENNVTSVATPPSYAMAVSSSSSSLSSLELRESPNQLSEDEEKPTSNAVIAVVFSSTTTPCNNDNIDLSAVSADVETSNNSTADANAGSFSASEGGKDCQCDNDSVFNSQSSIDAGGCSLAVSSCDGDDSSCADKRTNEEEHWDISKCFGGLFGRLLESQCKRDGRAFAFAFTFSYVELAFVRSLRFTLKRSFIPPYFFRVAKSVE